MFVLRTRARITEKLLVRILILVRRNFRKNDLLNKFTVEKKGGGFSFEKKTGCNYLWCTAYISVPTHSLTP